MVVKVNCLNSDLIWEATVFSVTLYLDRKLNFENVKVFSVGDQKLSVGDWWWSVGERKWSVGHWK